MSINRWFASVLCVGALGLAACSSSYAATLKLQIVVGEDPKTQDCMKHAMHLRDSIFHSYLDSLDSRIQELNGVAQRVDSLAKLFNDKGHLKLHLDGKSFGPIHVPETKVAGVEVPELNTTTPGITVPEVNIPRITIPDIDVEVSGDEAMWGGQLEVQGNINDLADGSSFGTVVIPDDTYTDGNSKYYMRRLQPQKRSSPVQVSGHVWLMGSK